MSKTKIRRKTRKLRKNKTHKKGKLIKTRSKRAGMYQFPPRASKKRGIHDIYDGSSSDEEHSRITRGTRGSKASTIESQKSDKEPLKINTDYMIEDFGDFEVSEPTEEDLKNRPSSTRTLRPSSTTTVFPEYDDSFSISSSSDIDSDIIKNNKNNKQNNYGYESDSSVTISDFGSDEEKPSLGRFKSISSNEGSDKSGGKTKKSKKSKKTKKRHNYKKMRGGMLLNTNYGVTNPYPSQDQHD